MREGIAFLARETGWSLEYIGGLSWRRFNELVGEIAYQKAVDDYKLAYGFASILALLATVNSKNRRFRAEDFVGKIPELPERSVIVELKKITLADGKEYDLPPLTLNMMCKAEEHFGKTYEELMKPSPSMAMVRYVLSLRLKMTEEEAGNLVDMGVMEHLAALVA